MFVLASKVNMRVGLDITGLGEVAKESWTILHNRWGVGLREGGQGELKRWQKAMWLSPKLFAMTLKFQ